MQRITTIYIHNGDMDGHGHGYGKLRVIPKILLIVLILILIVIRSGSIYENLATTNNRLEKKFITYHQNVSVDQYDYQGKTIRFSTIGDKNNQTIILIHGAPGSISMWTSLIKNTNLAKHYFIVIPDRLGYGGSDKAEVSILQQANSLLPLLTLGDNKKHKPILISHSYGGPIGAYMSYLQPEKISKHILISSVSNPESEPLFLISHLIKYPVISRLLPRGIMSSNKEKLQHKQQLRDMEPIRGQLRTYQHILHGRKDRIAPIDNVAYMQSRIQEQYLSISVYEQESHFIPFNRTDLIQRELE